MTKRTVLVTGATRGIGAAIAYAFAREGYDLAVTGRDADALERRVVELDEAGATVRFASTYDLAHRSETERLAHDVLEATGGVDVLVNNAGIGSREDLKPVVDFDPAFWDKTLEINLTAPFLLSRALLPAMVRKGWGRVIHVASINGRMPSMYASAYVTSKHGLIGLTKVMALEVAKKGVTVNSVCPGPVDVGDDRRLVIDARDAGMELDAYLANLTPMGGRSTPEEIAPLALFLASDGAHAITGQSIHVDRGKVML